MPNTDNLFAHNTAISEHQRQTQAGRKTTTWSYACSCGTRKYGFWSRVQADRAAHGHRATGR
jgi:hypothetical protein